MAQYLISEETLTKSAESVREITGVNDSLDTIDIAYYLNQTKDLIDSIARKFADVDEIRYIDGTLDVLDNDKITNVDGYAFYDCDALTTISLPLATSIGDYAFYTCSALTTIDLPSATSIGKQSYEYCKALTTVNLPNVTSIGFSAFGDCSALETVDLPSVTSINDGTFEYCYSLTTIDLPSVTSIGWNAFNYCQSLTTLILRSETLCVLDRGDAFNNTPIKSGTGYIYVPKALIEDYKAASNWSTYASQFRAIEDYPEICGGE